MIVRYNPSYLQEALRLGRMMRDESRYHTKFPYSEKKIEALLQNPNVMVAFSMSGQEILGFFIGFVQEMWFSERKVGFDLALYILPKYRGGLSAIRLIKEFEAFCHEKNCAEITLSSSAEISTDLAKRLYKKLGYEECGFISRKEL